MTRSTPFVRVLTHTIEDDRYLLVATYPNPESHNRRARPAAGRHNQAASGATAQRWPPRLRCSPGRSAPADTSSTRPAAPGSPDLRPGRRRASSRGRRALRPDPAVLLRTYARRTSRETGVTDAWSRSRPYRPAVRRIWNKQASRANRGRGCRRRT